MIIETELPNILHRGKVRDTYSIDDDLLLMVTTDRLSAFDVVLPTGIPNKGRVLTKISDFWFNQTKHLTPNHLVAMADSPEALSLSGGSGLIASLPPEIARQSMIVKRAERIDIECVVRGYIAGSAWSEYQRQGTVSGKSMPAGMLEAQAFPQPIFAPTTKAETGHDENMSDEEVVEMVGSDLGRKLADISIAIYRFGHDYAKKRGVILADTKFEFGFIQGQLILIDEMLTPDSSRFWDPEGYQPGHTPPSFDKQFVRDWLTDQGWNREPPAPELPGDIVARTTDRYLEAYHRITGERL